MNSVENYFQELCDIRSTGAGQPETSYYTALERLLDEIGKTLKPKVRAIMLLKNTGDGSPDFGLYTANQFQKGEHKPLEGQHPERGVIEVKSLKDDSWVTADGKQVTKYWGRYGQVLVTNYRDFVFVGQDADGKAVKLERYTIAGSEANFWAQAHHPKRAAEQHVERLTEYLKRVMLNAAPLNAPEILAWFLASYARDARARIESVSDLPGLDALRKGLEEALGMKFEGDDGEHFFRATLIQTLFYGIFSSWVLWARNHSTKAKFNWHEAAWNLHVPMIAGLFDQIATPQKLKPLKIDEVLDWTGAALNRVDQGKFFQKFEEEHAVQYFYEPFLKAYDPELRKELGVWYTPPEIVKYQVARVDTALREELDIADGLADPNVYVLDPCCGTGAYLVEVLRKIHETLKANGNDALTAQRLKKAAIGRVFGFEILPAPFVISHLQLGLLLWTLGAPFSDAKNERAGVYLTNALTGWEPPKGPKKQLTFADMQEERDAADKVKLETPILVILGNPPYNAFAGTSPEEEEGLVEAYKEGLNRPTEDGGWGIKKFNLDDLYVRFFRIAERRIVKGGKGIVSYISNFSYLSDPSFVVMRQRLLAEFDKLWFDCMNGDSRETGKLTPAGESDPSVFSTEQNKEGIRVGTAIGLLVRKEKRSKEPKVLFRHFWGVNKREELLDSLQTKNFNEQYEIATAEKSNRYSCRPSNVKTAYSTWASLVDLCSISPMNGLMEKRGGALIDIDRDMLEKRMQAYLDRKTTWDTYKDLGYGLTSSQAGFNPEQARGKILSVEEFDDKRIVRYTVRAFENRWCYYTDVNPIWNRPRPTLWRQYGKGNAFLATRPAGVASPEGCPFFYNSVLGDNDALRGHAYYYPMRLVQQTTQPKNDCGTLKMFEEDTPKEGITANLSDAARSYLQSLGIKNFDEDAEKAGLIWMHALAIGYSPLYLSENADGVRQDWPRIPLPDSKETLLASAQLGKDIAWLLDTETAVKGVSSGTIRKELCTIGIISKVGGGNLHPDKGELELTAGWGHGGKDGVTMPGKGKIVERQYSKEELAAIEAGAKAAGKTLQDAMEQLGTKTFDIYLNEAAYWKNVPASVWNYYIGGYQVIKKWLSYRENGLLGRGLKMEEAEYVTEMSRRLAAICLFAGQLDENYKAVKDGCFEWPHKE